jgi:uncharacterized protein (TIRG00374 family)
MTEPGARAPAGRRLPQVVAILVVAAALAWVARGIPLAEVAAAVRRLTTSEIAILLLVNLGVTLVFTLRWWVILRVQGHRMPFLRLSTYRLAGFALSYLTPGTQFGGEPLQIALTYRRHAVPAEAATAAVVIDRAVELLGNFTFLAFGLVLSLRLRLIPGERGGVLAVLAVALLTLPLGFLGAALSGRRPLTWLMQRLPLSHTRQAERWARGVEWVGATEDQIVAFCRDRPAGLAIAMGLSLVSWSAIVFESSLMLSFLAIRLDLLEVVGVITASRLALLVPVPGGLGALETSQVLALAALGYSRAEGLGLGLLIHARDLVFAAAGLMLGAWYARRLNPSPPGPRRASKADLAGHT